MLVNLCAVAVGGAIGASCRYLFGIGVAHIFAQGNPFYPFPLATFLINMIGCFAMGFLSAFFTWDLDPNAAVWKNFATTGLLGGFTTLSTFGLETMQMFDNGTYGTATVNVILTLGVCLLGIVLGRMLARTVLPAH